MDADKPLSPRVPHHCLALLALALVGRSEASERPRANGWNAAGAARYLDARLQWWRSWPKSARDHDTRCISCHTALPFALARPTLRKALGESAPSPTEQAMYADISKRVRMWREVEPFTSTRKAGLPKSSESRAVEAVLNALFLVTRDNEAGGHLSGDARQAFANMWPLQMQTGDLERLRLAHLQARAMGSETATYWGAALAAIAVARAPDGYATSPEIAPTARGAAGLSAHRIRPAIVPVHAHARAAGRQQPARHPRRGAATGNDRRAARGARRDGGWSLTRLSSWQRRDGTVIANTSDGFATAIITVALKDAGLPARARPIRAAQGWLITHQSAESGGLPATSINKLREPSADAYLFHDGRRDRLRHPRARGRIAGQALKPRGG